MAIRLLAVIGGDLLRGSNGRQHGVREPFA